MKVFKTIAALSLLALIPLGTTQAHSPEEYQKEFARKADKITEKCAEKENKKHIRNFLFGNKKHSKCDVPMSDAILSVIDLADRHKHTPALTQAERRKVEENCELRFNEISSKSEDYVFSINNKLVPCNCDRYDGLSTCKIQDMRYSDSGIIELE